MFSEDITTYRQRIVDRFDVPEIFDYLEVSMEEVLDAFPDRWIDNVALMDEVGYGPHDDDEYDDGEYDYEDDYYEYEDDNDDD